MDAELNQRTRDGLNICETCQQPREMYYAPWCPRCEPPRVEPVPTLNLVKALRHLEVNGHAGIKDRLWHYLMDTYSDSFRNDSWLSIELPGETKPDEMSADVFADFQTLKEVFGVGVSDQLVLDLSW